jgi:hypothetical protein
MFSLVGSGEINEAVVVGISLWSFLFVETVDNFLSMSFQGGWRGPCGMYTCPVPRATTFPKYGVLMDGRGADYVARAPGNPRAAEWTDLEDVGAPVWALPRMTCNCGRPCAGDNGTGRILSALERRERRIGL